MKLFIIIYVIVALVYFVIAANIVKTTPDKVGETFAACVFIAIAWPFFIIAIGMVIINRVCKALRKKDGDQK